MNIFKKFIPLCLCLSMICTLFGFQNVEGATAYDETISNGSFSDFQQALLNAKEFGLYSYKCSGKVTEVVRLQIVVSTVSVHTRKVSYIARLSSLITVQTVNVIITEVNLLLSKECL